MFKAVLQRGNKVQVPRLLRWQYRMEPDQVLGVEVRIEEFFWRREVSWADEEGRPIDDSEADSEASARRRRR